ncbi:DUF881 domain-containing protein [Alloscardovia theropitheci]|uniref:DUF881 domain-containing protein n=1 Tax=Alloscardovia theropitheci TaxID=2496842 RepID=A0A4R0QWK0_9BIFI|nr:DUF881 domain-containing protein [Alloscardovia theropitheci]TCD54797.1 DUF881 domain-containing protein [Alloscardovia theropitheci]
MTEESSHTSTAPHIIPPASEESPTRVRSAFSSGATKLGRHRIDSPHRSVTDDKQRESSKRYRTRSSSQLLEDLMQHPLDPMFEDATLTAHTITPVRRYITQFFSFLICVAVGIAGTQVVRNLQGDSREKVRTELASQVTSATQDAQRLENSVRQQRSELSRLTRQSQSEAETVEKLQNTNITTAQSAVVGDGLVVTLTDSVSANDSSPQGRVTDGQNNTKVTDNQLQYIISLLWAGGAEAISVNDLRLGPQTSVRAAGDTILIGVTGIQSPYTIQAIGDASQMESASRARGRTEQMLRSAGIGITFAHRGGLQLPAASTLVNDYARKEKE